MEQFDVERLKEQLTNEALPYGIELDDRQSKLLLRHLQLVLEKNQQVNLTRIVDPVEAVRLHIIDSLLLARHVTGSTFIDIGTGAGYPGIPLGVVTDARGVLLDSIAKKTDAVKAFIRDLGLTGELTVVCDRVESYALDHRYEFSCVVARAVAPTEVLLEYASPLLEDGGTLVVTKGDAVEDEAEIARVAALCGFQDVSRETLELPCYSGLRVVSVFKKVEKEKVKLPRRVGMARKRPLK